MSPRRAALLTAAYYAAIFAALGAHLPYWPLWLTEWGLTTAEVGFFMSAALVARIVGTTIVPTLADHWAIRRWTIAVSAGATVLAYLGHLLVDTPSWLMVATLVSTIAMAPSVPLGEGLGLRAAGLYGFSYAPIRAAGSLAFLVTNVGVGALLSSFGPDIVLWVIVVGFGLVAILGAVHPGGGAAPGVHDKATPSETMRLFLIPAVAVLTLATVAGQASHMVYYVYSVLDWRAQGISDATIGWLWASGVLLETVLMLGPGRRIVEALGPARTLALAGGAGIVRWSVLAMVPPLWALWPMQALHAATFGLAHLASMAFCAAALPPRMMSGVTGLMTGLMGGVTNALVVIAAGSIVVGETMAPAYWLATGLAALSLSAALMLQRMWWGDVLAT